jgi:hypothetical protein
MVHADGQYSPWPSNFSQHQIERVARLEPSNSSSPAAHPALESSSSPSDVSLRRRRRSSAFVEIGLSGDDPIIDARLQQVDSRPRLQVRFSSEIEIHEPNHIDSAFDSDRQPSSASYFAAHSFAFPSMPRLFLLALLLALTLPSLHNSPFFKAGITPIGAKAGYLKTSLEGESNILPKELVGRDNSPVNICTRWSQQTAVVNGTLYIYGGRASTQASQTSGTWSR